MEFLCNFFRDDLTLTLPTTLPIPSLSLSPSLFVLFNRTFSTTAIATTDHRPPTTDHRPPFLSLARDPNPNPLFLSSFLSPSHSLNPFISRFLIPLYHFCPIPTLGKARLFVCFDFGCFWLGLFLAYLGSNDAAPPSTPFELPPASEPKELGIQIAVRASY
ncbi:hypothetical protein ACSBR2_039183 [Camellia fascicularis]